MAFISACASFCIKKASGGASVLSILKNKFLYFGGILYVISAALNIWLLQRVAYSVLIPLGGSCYIWTMIVSYKFLHEKIGIMKIVGVVCIIAGVCCVAI
ncbi:MAG: EamA family transporter [Spirochaetaceae bacterium]|jgi:drug/metabolite transporter (DMT)-like permease|nr:EamA family transporter [Spirochaetaceae bacterium]